MEKTLLFLFVVFCCCWAALRDSSGGVHATVTQYGLSYVRETALAIAMQKVSSVSIPDQSGTSHVDVIGDVSWTLTNIVLSDVSVPSSSSSILNGATVEITASGATAAVNLDYSWEKVHWPHAKGHGSLSASADGVSLVLDLKVSDVSQRAHLDTTSVSVSISDFSCHSSEWIVNIVLDLFKNKIRGTIETQLANAISNAVDTTLNNAIQTMPIVQAINKDIEVAYGLTADPVFVASEYLTGYFQGEVEYTADPTPAPFSIPPMPDTADTRMLQAFISDYTFNSAGYALLQAGKLNVTITPSDVPSGSPVSLNTSAFEYIIPALYSNHPNELMELVVAASKSPLVTLNSTGAGVTAVGTVDVYTLGYGGPTYCFTLGAQMDAGVLPQVVSNNDQVSITGKVTEMSATLWLINSDIGTFSVDPLSQVLTLFLQIGVEPMLNAALAQGVPLPNVKNVQWISPTLTVGEKYLAVTTDIKYTGN